MTGPRERTFYWCFAFHFPVEPRLACCEPGTNEIGRCSFGPLFLNPPSSSHPRGKLSQRIHASLLTRRGSFEVDSFLKFSPLQGNPLYLSFPPFSTTLFPESFPDLSPSQTWVSSRNFDRLEPVFFLEFFFSESPPPPSGGSEQRGSNTALSFGMEAFTREPRRPNFSYGESSLLYPPATLCLGNLRQLEAQPCSE